MSQPQHPLERRHPLEQQPPPSDPKPRPRVNLRIPSVQPYATYVLIAINVLIFLARAVSPSLDEQIFLWGSNHTPDVFRGGEYYRLFTAMFLHAGIYYGIGNQVALGMSFHLISNMYILYAVGTSLERLFGHARFLIVYLLGGMGGSVLSILLGGPEVYSVGASGAVFAIVGAEFVFLWHHRKLFGEAGAVRRRSLIIFGVMNLFAGIASSLPGSSVNIDNWGHLGGLVGGVALAWFISPILNLRRHPDNPDDIQGDDINPLKRNVWVISIYVTVLLVLIFIGVLLAQQNQFFLSLF